MQCFFFILFKFSSQSITRLYSNNYCYSISENGSAVKPVLNTFFYSAPFKTMSKLIFNLLILIFQYTKTHFSRSANEEETRALTAQKIKSLSRRPAPALTNPRFQSRRPKKRKKRTATETERNSRSTRRKNSNVYNQQKMTLIPQTTSKRRKRNTSAAKNIASIAGITKNTGNTERGIIPTKRQVVPATITIRNLHPIT